ncbi:type IV pilin [Natrarchaeobaculum aegyptiacum]|uniref:Type IV pilin n=1 Tax=Natrarchaeobaculum aegyptiacum TaxID=745377 RepID=A0A2Z2HWP8_9EURY|nr:type IV pilin [Natrarchaeobaculum aegyptiacum]
MRTDCCHAEAPDSDGRAISPVLGVVLLLAITVCLAGVLAVALTSVSVGTAPATATFDLEADGETDEIRLEHVSGDEIDVRDLSIVVAVDGTDLTHQPPVPFVGADGFDGAPSGAFNEEADPVWRSGERVAFVLASTNDPVLESGDRVRVSLAVDGQQVARLETTAV